MDGATPLDRIVVVLVWATTAAIAVQAVLAGQFISGAADLRQVHVVVGGVLELGSLVLIALTAAHGRLRRRAPRLWAATIGLGVGVTGQALLGHGGGAGAAGAIAVHVPVGVALFAGSLMLALRLPATWRPVGLGAR